MLKQVQGVRRVLRPCLSGLFRMTLSWMGWPRESLEFCMILSWLGSPGLAPSTTWGTIWSLRGRRVTAGKSTLPASTATTSFPPRSSCSVTLKVSTLPGSPPRSVISVNCPSKQIRFSYSTWRTVTHLAKCPMCAVFAMTDCQPLAMQRRILEHERFALSFLPRNFLTGDILCKSRSEELEQEGLSMFQVLATVFEPEGKDREPNQESSIIQKARAIARVASWNRGHDPKFSSAGTERDSIHHCEEHWLPSTTQKNCKENCLWTQNIPDVLQQGIWLKNYVLPSSRNSK